MRETLVYMTHLDCHHTQMIMLERMRQQVSVFGFECVGWFDGPGVRVCSLLSLSLYLVLLAGARC